MPDPSSLPVFDYFQTLPGRFRFPARMSVLTVAEGKLALVSPVPIDDETARAIAALGEVHFLIAPNSLHHLYLADAVRRYPAAQVLAPPRLRTKRPDLPIVATLDGELPDAFADAVDTVRIEGAPSVDEFVFFHRATRTLVVTDLVFHVVRPEGFTANLVLFSVGCHGRFASSRMWRSFVKDRVTAAASVERLLAMPFETLVMAHGEVVRDDARARFARALQWLLPERVTLPAPG